MARPKPEITITGLKLDYAWTTVQIDEVIKLYENDASLEQLMYALDRPIIEILILLNDLTKCKKITSHRLLVLFDSKTTGGVMDD